MAIRINGKDVIRIVKNDQDIQEVYKNGQLLWAYIRSCFGSGFWVNTKPWINKETWKNKR